MTLLLLVYTTHNARAMNEYHDLTTTAYRRGDLNRSQNELIAIADKFVALNSYYGYDLYINNQLVKSWNIH